ncbi:hypothetical protein AXG93_4019s1090 [Marchantia polymorpha subsp. ruderalis]|uniref:Uncharacterized protein n=1 Tax=Marchantia polymorpha subsp. ruderalis TaxID=1480154 RepID=A0A176WK63_MARPO|nr:hypothetical protein AXG93_4019s1090 [Marchantia polymorpha subsp. ruderalis]
MGPSAVLAVAEGLMAPALLSSANSLRGDALRSSRTSNAVRASGSVVVRAATESGGGTRIVGGRKCLLTHFKAGSDSGVGCDLLMVLELDNVRAREWLTAQHVKVVQVGDKSAAIRDKSTGGAAIKLLSRVEQLKLLSKAEKAGLLSAAENAGFSLSSIEKLGLLSKAEEFGALSAATDRNTPGALLTLALALLIAGPVFVYFVPEDSTPLVILQVLVASISVLGGSAAFAASNFVSELQKSD